MGELIREADGRSPYDRNLIIPKLFVARRFIDEAVDDLDDYRWEEATKRLVKARHFLGLAFSKLEESNAAAEAYKSKTDYHSGPRGD